MTDPIRIQRKRAKGWKMPPNTVYVGRGSKWGNPFIVGGKNDKGIELKTISMVVEEYRRLMYNASPETYRLIVKELRGKNLACWCPLDQPCHADVLLKLANE